MAAATPEQTHAAAAAVLDACRRRGVTVAVAESCTGGLMAAALTAVPGSSAGVVGGVVAYADHVKRDLLGVGAELLRSEGAVSPGVARAMAAGVAARLGAVVGVGITGVAGPSGSEGKPPGLVHVAVVAPWTERAARCERDLGREENRRGAVVTALGLLLEVAEAGG